MTGKAHVVIGAGFGDEGKGLVTDYLAHRYGSDALVVRFNGGAQAAHTVQLPDGRRHVFHHVGSGTFCGAPTWLSRFFVCNPILFFKECGELAKLGVTPEVFVDPCALVTTPYDMMINQIVEITRGKNKHGSCGAGFGETIERNLDPSYALTVSDLCNRGFLLWKLDRIRREWSPRRLAALGIPDLPPEWQRRFSCDDILEAWLEDVEFFLSSVEIRSQNILTENRPIIFEGAQGLLLDQDRGFFPHVTRSNTGLKNVLTLARESGLGNLDVTYVTRAYLTRHGAGPLPHETNGKPYARVEDPTNIPNAWQGVLRFSWCNLDLLGNAIAQDLSDAPPDIVVRHGLAVTCMDQIDDRVTYIQDDALKSTSHERFLNALTDVTRAKNLHCSYGPTRSTLCSGILQMV